ncbi:MAG: L,D-transpeptidase family protein [Bacteroidetes bacterium]|nr:L,D-transpeptidase family protein [Bacteroidota bacterium]
MKYAFWVVFCLINLSKSEAQTTFIEQQMSFPKFKNAYNLRKDSLEKQYRRAHLDWPVKEIYIRSFKYDSQLEVWGRNNHTEAFRLFKTYKICALSGTIGPKRMDGDFQVPEGFYYVNEFRPKSNYHMALGINYPNSSDKLLSDSIKPGGDILIHGFCVTQGCIPIQNEQIEELYLLAAYAHASGQEFIPVHIFPIRFNNEKDLQFLKKSSKDEMEYQKFISKMRLVFDYFEQNKKLPIIAVSSNGDYQIY